MTTSISVVGNHFVDGNGATIRLLGVNRSGSEYMCTGGGSLVFDGPSDDVSIAAMASWHINVVRVPLNEDCWLGINGFPASMTAAAYTQAIVDYVNLLHAHGLYAILELHWNAPGTQQSTGQQVMVDADHGPAFWTSVATTFRADSRVLFDLYNEPQGISWSCLRDGCVQGFQTVGMQSLVNTVRATGATQPIMVGGLGYSGDISQWLSFRPTDSQLVASFHNYNFTGCALSCWTSTALPVAASVPLVTGELGENDCAHGYIDSYMAWADANGISYLGWAWNTYDCSTFPSLISNFDGTPTNFGIGFRDHLATLAVADACASTAISTNLASPQNIGTTVTLSATSLGCPDPNPLYKFLLRSPEGVWTTVRGFSTANTFVWNTTGYERGTYLTGVWVKDARSTNTYDAYAIGTFTLALPSCSSTNMAASVASPQAVGTTINFTATSIGCPLPLYQWWVRDTAGNWSIVPGHDFAHSSTTFAWNTSTLTEGTYQIGVWAKQVGSVAAYDAFAFVTYTLTVSHCSAVNLGTNVTSPQATGTAITLTPAAVGCPGVQYRFYVRDAGGTWHIQQDFGVANTYVWNSSSTPVNTTTAGTVLLGVWARQPGSVNSYDAFAFITFSLTSGPTCTVNIAADKTSPQTLGTGATWTATANGCPTGPLTYQFWVNPPGGTWTIVKPFSLSATYAWSGATAGTYQVGVWVKQAGSTAAYDNFAFTTFTLTPASTPQVCGSVGVTSDVASPQVVGTTVNFTAAANGCSSAQYQWWVRDTAANWAIVKDFAHSSPTLAWNTSGLLPGTYLVGVWARQTGSSASYEAYSFITYTLTGPPS